MISPTQCHPTHLQYIEDQVDILFRELELAIKWQRPSILLAIYGPESVHIDAEARLKKSLHGLGQTVHRIQTKNMDIARISSGVLEHADLEQAVFFVDDFDWRGLQKGAYDHHAFDQFRCFFVNNRIRVVFWLTEDNANDLAHNAPDFWTFRHCSVEFIGSPEERKTSELESAWQSLGDSSKTQAVMNTRDGQNVSSLADLPDESQSDVTHMNLLLTLGILNWRKGDSGKALEFLLSALKIAEATQDGWFKALCFNSLALVQTSMERIDDAISSYEHALEFTPGHIFPWSNLGNLYNKADRHEMALGVYQKALNLDSKDAISWNGLGDVYTKLGRTDDAILAYQKAIELAPNFAHPWNGLGNVYSGMGHTENAINAYQKTVELNQNFINPWICLGNIFKKQDRINDALQAFQKAVEIDPKNARIWNELGNSHFKAGDYSQAASAYNKAIELDPGFGMPYCNLAFTYTQQGRYAEAIPLYQRSMELIDSDRDKAISWNRLGSAYKRLYDYDNTIAAYDQENEPGTESAILRGNQPDHEPASGIHQQDERGSVAGLDPVGRNKALAWQGLLGTAKLTYVPTAASQVVALEEEFPAPSHEPVQDPIMVQIAGKNKYRNPVVNVACSKGMGESNTDLTTGLQNKGDSGNALAWNEIGNAYFNSGAYDQAISAYNKAIELDPAFGMPYSNLALAQANQGRYSEAIPLYKKSIELLGPDEEKSISWNRLGNAYRRLGDSKNAIAAYQMADHLDPDPWASENVLGESLTPLVSINPHVWNELGTAYFNTGAYDQAIHAYSKAIELDPDVGRSYSNLALLYSHEGRYAEAIPLYKKSIELLDCDKEKAVLWNRLGDAYRRLNDRENAAVAYEMAAELDPENVTLMTRARFSLLSNCYVG